MCENRAAICFLVSLVSLWSGLAAADVPALGLKAASQSTEQPPPAAVQPAEPEGGRGVVVESVGKGLALEKAGLQPGDVLYRWRRLPNLPTNPDEATGEFNSPFDWWELDIEQAPRGVVELSGTRAGLTREWIVLSGDWTGEVSPNWSGERFELLVRGQQRLDMGDRGSALQIWKGLSSEAFAEGEILSGIWLELKIGDISNECSAWSLINELSNAVCSPFARHPFVPPTLVKPIVFAGNDRRLFFRRQRFQQSSENEICLKCSTIAQVLNRLAATAGLNKDWGAAEGFLKRAMAIELVQIPDSLRLARTLFNLGQVARIIGSSEEAEGYYENALKIQNEHAPQGYYTARTLESYGNLVVRRGRSDIAEQLLRRALAIRDLQEPKSQSTAAILHNLGILADRRGDLAEAELCYRRALNIKEELDPDGLSLASTLNNLGSVARQRGDFLLCKEYYRRALEIKQRRAADKESLAAALHNMGALAGALGELDLEEEYYARSLKLRDMSRMDDLDAADTLNNMGVVLEERGDLDAAEAYYMKALRVREKNDPNGLATSNSMVNLGSVAGSRGDFTLANLYYQRSLALRERYAPASLVVAMVLSRLGYVAAVQGFLPEAVSFYERAVEIRERVAPGTGAVSLFELGRLHRKMKDVRNAEKYFESSLRVLDAQAGRLGTSRETESRFRSRNEYPVYREALSLQVELNNSDAAFHLLERSRAQNYLAMLAERELVFSDLPPELDVERRRLAILYDRTLQSLEGLSPAKDEDQVKKVQGDLLMIRQRQQDIQAEIRVRFPRLAAIQYPQPLDAAAVRQALDPGTVLLAYSVGERETFLFSVSPESGPAVKKLVIGEAELRRQVVEFRQLLDAAAARSSLGSLRAPRLRALSQELYALLVQPAEAGLGTGQRVLLLADGPLHLLPFAALQRPNGEYLGAWRPLHTALSATVWAELKATRRPATGPSPVPASTVAAFGDPRYPNLQSAEPRAMASAIETAGSVPGDFLVREAIGTGRFDWSPLPGTRREVQQIARLFPEGSARTYLGQEATEETAKALGREPRILHFAVHGHLDDRFPWNSALALTIPENPPEGRDNGLLQVWEILESVRFDANLVVLSACDTGLGEELGGEGLIGLTRAFQYAGARSVLATLWSVNDQATSELMIRFYKHLRAGLSKDQALQAAQQELIRGPIEVTNENGERTLRNFSSPYYWAGFQLYGDWQ